MSTRRFTTDQIAELSKNKNVTKCSNKAITYSQKFKLLAVNQYYAGLSTRQIFREAGFDLRIIGDDIPDTSLKRWKKIYNTRGPSRLSMETRGQQGGRPKTKGLTDAERIKRMEIEIAYLKAENDFLAKLRAAKKRLN